MCSSATNRQSTRRCMATRRLLLPATVLQERPFRYQQLLLFSGERRPTEQCFVELPVEVLLMLEVLRRTLLGEPRSLCSGNQSFSHSVLRQTWLRQTRYPVTQVDSSSSGSHLRGLGLQVGSGPRLVAVDKRGIGRLRDEVIFQRLWSVV